TALASVLLVSLLPSGRNRLRAAVRPAPTLAGAISFGAYALVLAALRRAPAASVAAVRETSVLIVAALAARMLGEDVRPSRLVGAAAVVGGVALIVL
ncbi:MAG TPA: EamA family transporter, partial [Actinomycetota bacterium]|nr:EamA family transporter [Actinomycetota bacterium]